MKNVSIFALSSLLLSVAARPMKAKRDIVWVTETAEVVETVQVTTTIWVSAGYTPPARTSTSTVETTSLSTSTVYVAPTPAAPTSTEAPAPVRLVEASYSSYVPPPPPATTEAPSSTYVPPPPPSPTPEAPSSSQVLPTPPASTYVPPPPPSPTPAPPSNGKVYSGDITYYAVGLGSCGYTNTDGEPVVAMAAGMMDKPSMCGKSIKIRYEGHVHDAKVVDTCPGCSVGSLDLSPTLFTAVAPKGDGRVHGVEWWWA